MIKSGVGHMWRSIKYFFGLWLLPKHYDIVFVYPNYFNRGHNAENLFFKPFFEHCEKYGLTFIVFEETNLKGENKVWKRNKNNIPFDFINLLVIVFRKILKHIPGSRRSLAEIDEIVTNIIVFLFLKRIKFEMCIYMPNNAGFLFRKAAPKAHLFEYQHGMIYNGHEGYLRDGKASKTMLKNHSRLLVFGEGFKELLISHDKSGFLSKQNVINIGQTLYQSSKEKKKENLKTILFSSQISSFFNDEEISQMLEVINIFLEQNKKCFLDNGYRFVIKHHPRFNPYKYASMGFDDSFVKIADSKQTLEEMLEQADMHMTFSSTVVFDAAMRGIPTIFLENMILPCDMYFNQYDYPLSHFRMKPSDRLCDLLSSFQDKTQYGVYSSQVKEWAARYYQPFDENLFQALIMSAKSDQA